MPKYKLSSGKFIIVKDDDVQDFLNSDIGKGATVVEEITAPVAVEDYVKTPGVDFDDYLKPVKTEDSASADPTVESKDTGSKLGDGLSELQSAKPNRYLKFKSGKVVYEDEYLSNYAGKDGLPASFDDYAKMWKTKPLTFDSPEITVKSKKTEELIPSLKNAWKKREYNKDTEMYEPSFNDVLLGLDEEEAVQMFRSVYKGSGIEFEESNQIFDKKKGKELDREVLFTDAVRMKILDKKTGEYIYSKPIELQRGEDFNERNESIINDFIESNKDKIDASKWVRTQNKQLIELEKWQEENFKPELKQKETQLKQKFLDNPNLFDAVDEIVPDIENASVYTFGGGVSVPTTKTIKKYPYEKEIKKKISILSNKYPNKTKEEIQDLANKSVRSDLYESARLDFIYAKNEEYLSNSSNVKKTQGLLYSAMLNKVNKEADKFNESSKKIQLSQENFYQAEKDLNKVIKYYIKPDENKNKEVGELFAKYDVDMVDSFETTLDDEFNEKYGIKKGSEISTNFYNIINRINSSADSNKNIISAEASKIDDAIDMMTDNSTIADAASKNYDLLEKYLMNTALGFQDIAVGTAFLTGNILTLGQSEALKKKGVEYIKYTNKLRDSYVRDVSFDNAFNSAENTGKFIAQEISNQIPILVAMAASGGFGGLTAGVSSTGKQMMDMEYEIATGRAQYSDVELWLKSVGFGVAEGVFSQLTTVRALGRARARWISSGREQVLDNSMKEYFRSKAPTLIYEPLLEAGGEALTTGTQNLITGRDFVSDMDHSAVSGFGFGLLFAGIPFMKGMYNSRFSTYESLNEVRQAQRELVDLERRFQTSQSSADSNSNKLIVDLINKKREKINDLVTSREKLINNNLTSEGASKIISLIQKQADLQNRFEDINNNNDLDQNTKDQLLAEIKQDFDFITRAKEKALSGNLLKANETEWEAFKALNRSKAETYMSEAESILKGERDGRDVQKADVNRKAYDLYYGDLVREENSKLGKSALFKKFTVFETVQDAINSLNNRDDLSDKDRNIIINGLKNGNDGYADPNTDEAVAIVENQVRNQRRYTKVHEIGHQVFWKLLGKDNNSKAMKGIASQLLSTMKSLDKKLYEKFINDGIDDDGGNIIPAEVISRFLEYVSENKITNVQKAKGIAGLFGVMVQKEFSKDYNFDFRGENDIFNFVVGIGNKIKSGEFSTADIARARKSGIVDVAEKKGEKTDFVDTVSNAAIFSKSVEQIQKEILALEEQYDEQNIDYYDFENRMDILEAELEKAKKAPKETQVKPVKKSTQLSVQDIKDQIEQLDEDLYSGVIDDIDYEQRLDLLEEKLKQAELRVTNPKKAQENQDKIVKQSVDKFKKDVSEETVSDKNKNIAKINEDIANEMLELGANQVSDIKDPIKRKQIIDKLGRNNLGAVTNLTKRAAAAGKNLAIDDNLKIGYDEFFSGFSEELSALIKSYKVEVDGKRVPFGAYMNKNLPLRYGQILDNALKGRIEGSKSLDVQAGEKGFAGSIIADRSADFDAVTSAEMGLPVDDLIDVTTFRKVKDKVETIKESIDLTGVNLDNLTYRKIQDDYSGQVGAELLGLWDKNAEPDTDQDKNDFQKLAERIEGTRTLNYGKDTGGEAEVRAMQGLFLDYNDAVKFIKTMPEFNVAPFETTIDEQGRSIDLTEDARGYSTGISNKLLKEFYEPYIDPKSKSSNKDIKSRAITSPSGRGKGKTSQVAKVYRLKPEYRGKISRQTVQDLQKKIGITPVGEAFIPMKGKNRTEFGTALQGLTKMYATNVANTIIRKKIVDEGLTSVAKPVEKLLADIGGGKSRVMFSKNVDNFDPSFNVSFSKNFNKSINDKFGFKSRYYELDPTSKNWPEQETRFLKDYENFVKNTSIGAFKPRFFISSKNTLNPNIKKTDKNYNLAYKRRKALRNKIRNVNKKYKLKNIGFVTPPNLYGKDVSSIESNIASGKVLQNNDKYSSLFDKTWLTIADLIRKDRGMIPFIGHFLETSGETDHWTRLGAPLVAYDIDPKSVDFVYLDKQGNKIKIKVNFEYEHAMPVNVAVKKLFEAAADPNVDFEQMLRDVKENYKLIALSAGDNYKLVKAKLASKMPRNWNIFWDRYFNKEVASIDGGINMDNIMLIETINEKPTITPLKDVLSINNDGSNTLFSKSRLDEEFNKIIENKTGILATDEISEVKAKMIANNKRRFNIFIPPSAEDFVGLLYATLGKGKVGEKQMMFYDRTLIRPYARAMQAISRDRIDLGRAFKDIRKEFKATPKDLKKKVPNSLFTKEQAVRIYIWDSIGKEVPGLSVDEVNELANYVADNKDLKDFAEQVMRLNPGSKYASPKETWTTGTITTDLLETLNESRRAKHLGRWQQNVDEIFSKENLNKLEAAYGTSYRKAMENMLTRMKTGRNRTYGTDSQTAKWIDWVNGSVGTIMFLNARSAVLQTISAANFINFGDNNVFAAGKAFANQKQYWSDFAFLMNSDYLVERRDSLKININEADIAEAAQKKGARGAINYLLKLGFTPTKFADSFAIASGGATFYRNRLNALIKKGMDPAAAEKAAMRDFIEKSEESQQSSRPDKISQEQAGPLGRVILAFANTPAQYARIIKKAASDLKNRRGSDKENISKIIYYGLAQNLLFNALQQAIFAVAFGDEEDEGALDDKKLNIVNGMLDGIIRGTGVGGAIFTVVKNSGLRIYKESNKKRPNYESVVDEALKISPPISSKISKLKSAGRTFTWDAKEIKGKGLDITNPAIGASAKILSAGTNLPLDRVVRKIENLKAASDSELETYKRLALVLGWGKWELGIKDEKWKDPNAKPKIKNNTRKIKQRKIKQRKITIR